MYKNLFYRYKAFIRYVLVSAIALGYDYIFYMLSIYTFALNIPVAASLSYSLGMLVSYFLMSLYVFTDGWLKERRTFEALLFVLSGIIGAILTYISSYTFVLCFGSQVQLAKITSVVISFFVVFIIRKHFVFRIKTF